MNDPRENKRENKKESESPYSLNYHSYLENLKSNIDKSENFLPYQNSPQATNIFSVEEKSKVKQKINTTLWALGVGVIAVSVVAFTTQIVLIATNNAKTILSEQGKSNTPATSTADSENQFYVRADLTRPLFEEISSTTSGKLNNSKPIDLGIPGVTAIGFDSAGDEKVLTDNINKYSPSTLVVGGRQGEAGGANSMIGGGDDLQQIQYSTLPKAVEPVLNSRAYLVADRDTGEIILEKNADTAYPLASVSKLMTAVIAREKMDLQSVAIVSRDASNTYGAQGSLGVGEKIRLTDLLFPLLMESSNDAAEVFADQYGNAKFMEEMNKKAASLDMNDTYYGDPSGLDPQNVSTPHDLLKLARYIYKNDPQVFDMTRVKQFSIKNHTWYNRNALLPVAGYTGGKNGYIDQSLQTTVSMFDVELAKGGVRNVVVIILKSPNKYNDAIKLLNYLKKSVAFQP